jgi:hypothetical protein
LHFSLHLAQKNLIKCVEHFNHQNILEIAQGHISLSITHTPKVWKEQCK